MNDRAPQGQETPDTEAGQGALPPLEGVQPLEGVPPEQRFDDNPGPSKIRQLLHMRRLLIVLIIAPALGIFVAIRLLSSGSGEAGPGEFAQLPAPGEPADPAEMSDAARAAAKAISEEAEIADFVPDRRTPEAEGMSAFGEPELVDPTGQEPAGASLPFDDSFAAALPDPVQENSPLSDPDLLSRPDLLSSPDPLSDMGIAPASAAGEPPAYGPVVTLSERPPEPLTGPGRPAAPPVQPEASELTALDWWGRLRWPYDTAAPNPMVVEVLSGPAAGELLELTPGRAGAALAAAGTLNAGPPLGDCTVVAMRPDFSSPALGQRTPLQLAGRALLAVASAASRGAGAAADAYAQWSIQRASASSPIIQLPALPEGGAAGASQTLEIVVRPDQPRPDLGAIAAGQGLAALADSVPEFNPDQRRIRLPGGSILGLAALCKTGQQPSN